MEWQCNVCLGKYSDTTLESGSYFHVCPDVTVDASKDQRTPRPGGRDENPVASPDARLPATTKRDGAGRTKL